MLSNKRISYLMKHENLKISQEEFAQMIGVSQPLVSKLLGSGIIPTGGTWRRWHDCYIAHLRGVIAGQRGTVGMGREEI